MAAACGVSCTYPRAAVTGQYHQTDDQELIKSDQELFVVSVSGLPYFMFNANTIIKCTNPLCGTSWRNSLFAKAHE